MELDPWPGLELRHLAALAAIAEERSFRRAAARLGYTQSAISQQIAALERVAGAVLIDRPGGPRPVQLTPAGRLLLAHSEPVRARVAAARADLAAIAREETAMLQVGTYQSVGSKLLPRALREFGRSHPHVAVRLTELNSDDELLSLVEDGKLDLTFAVLPLGDGPFEWIELIRDPYLLVVAADSPLAQHSLLTDCAEIDELELIGFRACRSVEAAESQLRAAGVSARIVCRSNDNGTLLGLVAAGLGAALVPRLALDGAAETVVALDLGDRIPPRVLVLAWHRERRQVGALCDFVETTAVACAGTAGVIESSSDSNGAAP